MDRRVVTAEDRARMLAEAEELRAANALENERANIGRVGPTVDVRIGCEAYSRYGDEGSRKGGTIVEIGDRHPETGYRWFVVLDRYAPDHLWHRVLDEADVDPELYVGPEPAALVAVVRRLAGLVHSGIGGRFTGTDHDCIRWMGLLRAAYTERTRGAA